MPRAVDVPEPYARLFDEAEDWVRRHFADRVESPERGVIEIGGERYILLRASSASVEFFDLIRRLYADEGDEEARSTARSLLYDVAHTLGYADAGAFAARRGDADELSHMAAGPLHFAYAGWARVDIHEESRPAPGEGYRLIFDHEDSFEADSWLRAGRTSESPVCVMSAGYSSGWCEAAFGVPLVTSEVQCEACGDDHCRFVMAPPEHIEEAVAEWARRHPDTAGRGHRYEIPGFFRRKKWEAELRDKEARYRSVFESVADGLAVVDDRGRVRELNPAARDLLGVAPEEAAPGADLEAWFPERDTWRRALGEAAATGEALLETTLRSADDRLLEVDVRLSRQGTGRPAHLLVSIRDVTERRRARAAVEEWTRRLEAKVARRTADLRRANERLREDMEARLEAERDRRELEARLERARRMESLGVLAGGVAHDLNNLLGPLVGYPELILPQLPDDSPVRPFVLEMQRAATETGAIVQDLLSLARRGVYHMETLDLGEVVQEFATSPALARRLRASPRVSLRVEAGEAPVAVRGSRHHLRKVLLNLALNALDAMPDGGELGIAVERLALREPRDGFEEVPPGEYAVLSVSDTGEGIPAEEVERIFEPFYSTRAMGRSGSGLGLAVVYGVAHDHGARVDVQSAPGEGSRLALWFPAQALEARAEEVAVEAEPSRGREVIVVVDDMSEQRALAAALLESLGYEVVTFASGREAVSYVAEEATDLVLLDLVMPGDLDGLQTWRAMQGHRSDLSVVVVSGYDRHSRLAELREMGVSAFLQKPYTRAQLARAVRRALDARSRPTP